MSDPPRLLRGPLGAEQRAALEVGLALKPSASEKERMWQGISVAAGVVGLAALGGAATGALKAAPAAAKTAQGVVIGSAKLASMPAGLAVPASVSLGKLLVTWTIVGTSLGLGAKVVTSDALWPASSPAASSVQSRSTATDDQGQRQRRSGVPVQQQTEAEEVELVTPTSDTPAPPERARGVATSTQAKPALAARSSLSSGALARAEKPEDRLERERVMIAQARQQLRSGRLHECLNTLRAAARQFPNGVLGQERMALSIEVMTQLDQSSDARQLASEFLERYPESPYTQRVKAFTAVE